MQDLFQTIRISLKLPSGQEVTKDFIGQAICSQEEYDQIEGQSVAESITGFGISKPVPFSKVETEFGDLISEAPPVPHDHHENPE